MLLQGKKALILGLANNKSIAYGIANAFKEQGARLAFNYVGDAIKKRVEPLSEELGGEFTFQCDVTDDAQYPGRRRPGQGKVGRGGHPGPLRGLCQP